MTRRSFAAIAIALCLAGLVWLWFVSRPVSLELARVSFADLPGWSHSHLDGALASFRRSCTVLLAKPDASAMGGLGYAGAVADWRKSCSQAGGDARQFFQANFTPYRVSAGFFRPALFTGYYEPKIAGSRMRHGPFQTPVYGAPADLVRADLGQFFAKLKGEHISGRLVGRTLVPFASRAQIDAKGLADAPILFFTDDPIALFFLQIQGSGRVMFADGTAARVGYAGDNGRAYTPIGRILIQQGALRRDEMSMQAIGAWLRANPARAQAVMEKDQSFVFFREAPIGQSALGSPGALGVGLTPLASLAVDPRIHALGVPFYLAASGADPVQGLMVAQDVGGAIRGAVRADIFFGFGVEAQRRAGALDAHGRLYLLLPNERAAKIGGGKTYPLSP